MASRRRSNRVIVPLLGAMFVGLVLFIFLMRHQLFPGPPPAPVQEGQEAAPPPRMFATDDFRVELPGSFSELKRTERLAYYPGGAARVVLYSAESDKMFFEVEMFQGADADGIFAALRDAESEAFRPTRFAASTVLSVTPHADTPPEQAMKTYAALLTSRDAAAEAARALGRKNPEKYAPGIQKRLYAEADPIDNQIVVSAYGQDPEKCRTMADAAARFFLNKGGAHLSRFVKFLEKENESARENVQELDEQLARFRTDYELSGKLEPFTEVEDFLTVLEVERERVKIQLQEIYERLKDISTDIAAAGKHGKKTAADYRPGKPETGFIPPNKVQKKTNTKDGPPPEERINHELRFAEMEILALGMQEDPDPAELKKWEQKKAGLDTDLEKEIKAKYKRRRQGKQGGTPLHRQYEALELEYALSQAHYRRLDTCVKERKTNRPVASGAEENYRRLARQREAFAAVEKAVQKALAPAQRRKAESAAEAEIKTAAAAPEQAELPGGELPPLILWRHAGGTVVKKETTRVAGSEALGIRFLQPWRGGRRVVAHEAWLIRDGILWRLRVIALDDEAMNSPAVARFFTTFAFTQKTAPAKKRKR